MFGVRVLSGGHDARDERHGSGWTSTGVNLQSPQNPIAYLTDAAAVLANGGGTGVQADAFALAGNYVQSSTRSYTSAGFHPYSVLALPTAAVGSSGARPGIQAVTKSR